MTDDPRGVHDLPSPWRDSRFGLTLGAGAKVRHNLNVPELVEEALVRREAQLAKQQQEQATAQQARVEAQRQRQLQQQARQQQAEWQTTDDSEGPPTPRLRTQDTSSQPWWRQPSHYEGNSGFNQR